MPGQDIRRKDAHGGHDAKRNGEIIMAAFLWQVGRGQVDGDPLRRQGEPNGAEGRPHPFAAFADRLVGQANDHEIGLAAARHVHLYIDRRGLDPFKCKCRNSCDHRDSTLSITL